MNETGECPTCHSHVEITYTDHKNSSIVGTERWRETHYSPLHIIREQRLGEVHCSGCSGWVRNGVHDEGYECLGI